MRIFFPFLLMISIITSSRVTAQPVKVDSLKINKSCDINSIIKSSIKTEMLFNRTIKWINDNYQNPDKVIMGKLENEKIIIAGVNSDIFNTRTTANYGCDIFYHIYFTFKDTLVNYRLTIDNLKFDGLNSDKNCDIFYKKDGSIKNDYLAMVNVLELSINRLYFSYVEKISSPKLSSDEALAQLKKAKEKLDLQLITQEEYDKLKAELQPFIK